MATSYQSAFIAALENCITSAGGTVPTMTTPTSFEARSLELLAELNTAIAGGGGGGGLLVQRVTSTSSVRSTGSGTIPYDNTIPQITEGNQFLSGSITPTDAANYIDIELHAWVSEISNTANAVLGAVFRDAVANALVSGAILATSAASTLTGGLLALRYRELAGSTIARTYSFRAGCTGGSVEFNGLEGASRFGGTFRSSLILTEVQP
ncbi:MAG: hypothetical protein AAFZ49_10770 [Cyanobacteria bacterium J06659_2]